MTSRAGQARKDNLAKNRDRLLGARLYPGQCRFYRLFGRLAFWEKLNKPTGVPERKPVSFERPCDQCLFLEEEKLCGEVLVLV